MLTAAVPVLTARGDELNPVDGFVKNFKVVMRIGDVEADEKEKIEARPASTLINVGKCKDMTVDDETGFVELNDVLLYTELICSSDNSAGVRKCVSAWFKKPTSVVISASLMRRDHGASQFSRKIDGETEYFVHPALLLANVEVGASTRTWLVSVAAFALSFSQLIKAFEQSPQDFANIDDFIAALRDRVKVLNSKSGSRRLCEAVFARVKPPYADLDYRAVAEDAISRLALFARADLAVLSYIKTQVSTGKVSKRSVTVGSTTPEQLHFLRGIAETNGDLWFERSAHSYNLGDQTGAMIVFPSGHLYSIVGEPGVSAQDLMKRRTALSRMESLAPYLPYEFSGYTGDIGRLALLEAQQRKGAAAKTATRADIDAAKMAIATYALRLTTEIIVSPVLFDLLSARGREKSTTAASSQGTADQDDLASSIAAAPARRKVTAPIMTVVKTPLGSECGDDDITEEMEHDTA